MVEAPRRKGTACLRETEAGVAEASAETQIAAIEKSIQRHIKNHAGGAGV